MRRRLGVNIDHVATLRQARGTVYPDPVAAAGIAEAGLVNPTIAKKWAEAGGRIIGETQPVVNWSVLASPKAPPEFISKMTESLLAMNSQSTDLLAEIGVKQWVKAERSEYLALLDYTRE